MSRKKEIEVHLSPEEHQQIEELLAHHQDIAQTLQQSKNQAEAGAALATIDTLSEPAQLSLLKSLTRAKTGEAADILTAIHMLSPNKEVRKEAKRALLLLGAAKIHPQWTPPSTTLAAIQPNIAHPPRFWKGYVTRTREDGELQLQLFWEQGFDYTEVRVLIFLLDFWQEGVKETLVQNLSKRQVDERLQEMRTQSPNITLSDCNPVEGKRLLEEALSVNTWRGSLPADGYRTNIGTINRLIDLSPASPEAATRGVTLTRAQGEFVDRKQTFIDPELTEQEVVIYFTGAWAMGDYGLAYDLLSEGSSQREGLSRDEWIERHRTWADEAHPAALELGFTREREARPSGIWIPGTSRQQSTRKEVEMGWSLELSETPMSGTLKEMPMGTAINKETGRHWFWTSYSLVRQQEAWRIQQISDEGARIQGTSIDELQKQIKEQETAIEALAQRRPTNATQLQELLEEMAWRLTYLLHYSDALIARLPLDRQVVEDAYSRSVLAGNTERSHVYLERLAQRFPENRGEVLRRLGSTLAGLAYEPKMEAQPERQKRILARAEEALRESIAVNDIALGHLLLGELLISMGRHEDAEAELLKTQTMQVPPDQQAAVEAGLGNIAMRRERMEEAIPHYERVAEIAADYPGNWFNLGFAHRLLGHLDQAATYYEHAIKSEPQDTRPYSELIAIAMNQSDTQKAKTIAEQGVQANPDSAHLYALLASVLFESGDQRGARRALVQAEAINPELEIVQSARTHIEGQRDKKRLS